MADATGSVETLVIGDDQPSRRRRSATVRKIVVATLLVGALLLYLSAVDQTSGRLPRDAVVGGVAVGGLDQVDAERRLRAELKPLVDQPFQVKIGSDLGSVPSTGSGLSVDYAESARVPSRGGRYDPRQIWWVLRGGSPTEPVMRVDEDRLSSRMEQLAGEYDLPAYNAGVEYEGSAGIVLSQDQDGLVVDRAAAGNAFRVAYLMLPRPTVTVPVTATHAAVRDAAARRAMDSYAFPAVSGDIIVNVEGGGQRRISPAVIRQALTFVPRGHELVPHLDARTLLVGAKGESRYGFTGQDLVAAVLPVLGKTGQRARTVTVRKTTVLRAR